LYRAVGLAFSVVGESAIIERGCIFWIELDRLVKVRDGAFVVLLVQAGVAASVEAAGG
jgi:hypothetical protein